MGVLFVDFLLKTEKKKKCKNKQRKDKMNKKLILTSMLALGIATPAMALSPDITSSSTFPDATATPPQYMQANYRYLNAAIGNNMDSVYSGTVYAIAEYVKRTVGITPGYYQRGGTTDPEDQVLCPANSDASVAGYYCPGAESVAFSEQDQILESCPNDYPLVGSGASLKTQCYKTCVKPVGATAMIGADHWGAGFDTCEPQSCESGYSYIGHTSGIGGSDALEQFGGGSGTLDDSNYAYYYNASGTTTSAGTTSLFPRGTDASYLRMSSTDIAVTNDWVVRHGDGVSSDYRVYGKAYCADPYIGVMQNAKGTQELALDPRLAPTQATTAQFGGTSGTACFCKLNGFYSTAAGSRWQALESKWMYAQTMSTANACNTHCAETCAGLVAEGKPDYPYMQSGDGAWVTNLFASASGSILAKCEANTIKVKWYANWGRTQAEIAEAIAGIATNNAGTVTYGGDVYTPAVQPKDPVGYIFKGWRFSKTAPEAGVDPEQTIGNPD